MTGFSASEYTSWVQKDLHMQLDPRLTVFDTANTSDGQIERGIRTNAPINANSTLAIVPFMSLLTIESPVGDSVFESLRHQLREDDMLVLLLLHEQYKGTASRWYPHFAFIPKVYHSIANYSEDDLEMIKGSNLYDLAYRWKEQLKQDFDELVTTLETSNFQSELLLGGELQYDQYMWALSTVWSRCITVSGRNGRDYRCVVPFIDLLNHHPNSQVGHAYNPESDSLYLVTGQALRADQEVSLHYGPCTNSRLLMLYGFTLSNNPYDMVELFASLPEDISDAHAALNAERLSILRSLQLPHNTQPFRLPLSDTESDAELQLLLFLRIFHATPVQLHQLRSVASTLPAARILQVTLSPDNETNALRAAIAAVKDMLDAYPTTLPQDLMRLRTLGATGGFVHPANHELHALYLVLGEKKVLHKVLKRFETRLSRHLQDIGEAPLESA